ncbi:hypothetical protein PV10_00439 [Exophiala mesophila]|uniref:Major facilitator superfamily (MFS) profile domain-containing protein n=1 Tax=Exophiala mesophila TaxID=212818 RepID=A0A0D1Y7C3_EXOME|nr:uncharacterized protein PV10_00439 [Exophiala mesophila]KIV96596.1 hypothetical protein PV10_00439 [Exophiala mesophila]
MATPIAPLTATDEVKASEGNDFIEVMKEVSDEIDHAAERAVTRKTDRILLPVLCTLMLVAFLDRTNIGSARVFGLDADLNMTGSDYNIALFIFFIPYLLLDVPANIIMKKVQPPYYFTFLIFSWGMDIWTPDLGNGDMLT